MLDELSRIFRQSVSAFRTEANRREPEDQVAELLSAMRREWVAARAELKVLAEREEGARAELARERDLLAQTERRGGLAEGIGDAETARIAGDFATRHRQRIAVLEQKVSATGAERALRVAEVEEMKGRYQEADANRYGLVAEIRARQHRSDARSTAEGAERSFADWDRMREKIGDTESYVDALHELDDSPPPPAGPSAAELEERLRELKRRMGKG